jgi:hypothetical protein
MLLWQLKLQKPFAWDQQVLVQKSLQQLLACITLDGRCMLTFHLCMQPPTLTWCCCGKAQATTERQMMAHAWEQGRAACAAQVNISVVCNEHYCMHGFRSAG